MAEKELGRVRNEFVKRVPKETFTQLLEELVRDGVFNDLEKESILEENSSRVDKARCFIDTVKKKGDKACRKMFSHLQIIDPTLCSQLDLSSGHPAQPATVSLKEQQEQKWSQTLIPCTDDFRSEVKDKNVYPVSETSKANRVALLITNKYFYHKDLTRHGAERDEWGMLTLLQDLGYEVVKYRDISAKEIDKALIEFSKHPKLAQTDSVVVVIMSHGKMGKLLGGGTSGGDFEIDKIYKRLNTLSCPALLNKPKIIIIQGRRGGADGSVNFPDETSHSSELGQLQTDAVEHKEKDFITLLSCTPDTVSYRLPEYGSFLIQYIVEVFNTCACRDDIEELFRKVMQRFEDYNPHADKRQMPTKDRCTLTRRFYLFPGK